MQILSLHKRNPDYTDVGLLKLNKHGIVKSSCTHKHRQLLIVTQQNLDMFNLTYKDLKPNIVIDDTDNVLYKTLSGTYVMIGNVLCKLTFLCEPCKKLSHIIKPNKLLYNRGYLAQVIGKGTVSINDTIAILDYKNPVIPYALKERMAWLFDRTEHQWRIKDLVRALSLSNSYCRAIPNMLKTMDEKYKSRLIRK